MYKYHIPPDDCLVLKAFRDSNSLREASKLLNCDPAGLTRRVQSIANNYGLIQKVENRWLLTPQGLDMATWVEDSIQNQSNLLSSKTNLRIASTSWLSEALLIPSTEKLRKQFDHEVSLLFSVPNKGFENSILGGEVDFAIVCHPPETPEIEHRQIASENWIAVAPFAWTKNISQKNIDEFFLHRPFIRHTGLNEDILMPNLIFKESGVSIDHLIGVRSAVCSNLGWSFLPRHLVKKDLHDGVLAELPYQIPISDRKVCLWWLRNRQQVKRLSTKVSSWIKEICA